MEYHVPFFVVWDIRNIIDFDDCSIVLIDIH